MPARWPGTNNLQHVSQHKGLSYLSQVSNSAASTGIFNQTFVGEFDDKQLTVGIKKDFTVHFEGIAPVSQGESK